jgi:hypothetical protein
VQPNLRYDASCPQFTEIVNSYIELQGMYRFKDDHEWGFMLRRFQNENVTSQDIDFLNNE